jgi:hypothetical protein
VTTPTGEVAIAKLTVGSTVLAYDPKTGKASTQTVEQTFINHDTDLLNVTLQVTKPAATTSTKAGHLSRERSGRSKPVTTTTTEVVQTTANHPWLTADHGWLVAGDLGVGEPVQELDGSTATVVVVQVVPGAASMWDLTVSNIHTFAVGDGAYVVHNNNCNPSSTELDRHLGGTPNDGLAAHHLVPRQLASHRLVQLAMQGGFDIDEAANGLLVRDGRHAIASEMFHSGSHATYTAMVQGWLSDTLADLTSRGNLNPNTAATGVRDVASTARDFVLSHVGRIS